MEKNNSLLYAILGGVITCFVCVGMVFLYPSKGSNNLKSNTSSLSNQGSEYDEDFLGDTCGSWTYGEWRSGSWSAWTCTPGGSTTASPTNSMSGTTYTKYENINDSYGCSMSAGLNNCNACHREQNWTRTATCNSYSACDNGKYLKDGHCEECPAGSVCYDSNIYYCPAGTYNPDKGKGSADDCLKCADIEHGERAYSARGATSCSLCSEGDLANSSHSNCEHAIASGCSLGYWRGQYNCEICPAGSYCPDGIKKTACTGAQYTSTDGQTTPQVCDGGKIVNSDHTSCTECTGNKIPNADHTVCVACGPNAVANSTHSMCVESVTTPRTDAETCTTPNTYYIGTSECKYCPDGYKATVANPECHIEIAPGSYLVQAGQPGTAACPANTYSLGGTYNLTGENGNIDNIVGSVACKSCKSLYPNKPISAIGSGPDSCREDDGGTCSLSVTSDAQIVSPKSEREEFGGTTYPDTFTVTVTATGSGCNKRVLSMSTDGKSERNAADNNTNTLSDGFTIHILYHATVNQCTTTTVTATATNPDNSSDKVSGSTTVEIKKSWSYVGKYCGSKAKFDTYYHSYAEANANSGGKDPNYYAIALDNPPAGECNNERYYNLYVRGCGGGSAPPPETYDFCCVDNGNYTWYKDQSSKTCPSGTIDESKTSTTCKPITERVPHCYIDNDGHHQWTDSPSSGWKLVEGVTKEENCKDEETPACYQKPDGEYTWGKYATEVGYTLITSIKDDPSCKTPTPEEACYKNDNGDYQWSATPLDGYTKVEGVNNPKDCAPEETPACYVYENKFVWGTYEKVNGYIKLDGVGKDECDVPSTSACYIAPDGKYTWGNYGNDPSYTLVPSIQEDTQCNNDVPTPSTASNVSRIVYVFMAILMASGIGFIYYSSVVKKQQNQ